MVRAAANMLSVPLQLDPTKRSYNATQDIIKPKQSTVLQLDLIIWRNKVSEGVKYPSFFLDYVLNKGGCLGS